MKKALRPVSFLAALLTLLTVFASTGAAEPPSVHDTVYFGSFPQTADGNAEPLKWLVLEVRDDKARWILLPGRPHTGKTAFFGPG